MQYRLILLTTLLFGLFIGWIVYLADTGRGCLLFDLVKIVPCGDKIGHFMLFGLLASGCILVFKSRTLRLGRVRLPLGALLVFALAAAEECSQHFICTRTCDITDLMADMAGIAVAGLFFCRTPGARA